MQAPQVITTTNGAEVVDGGGTRAPQSGGLSPCTGCRRRWRWSPPARPSRPSMRFTAFAIPTTHNSSNDRHTRRREHEDRRHERDLEVVHRDPEEHENRCRQHLARHPHRRCFVADAVDETDEIDDERREATPIGSDDPWKARPRTPSWEARRRRDTRNQKKIAAPPIVGTGAAWKAEVVGVVDGADTDRDQSDREDKQAYVATAATTKTRAYSAP